MVRWPAEADRREELESSGLPRLLLVEGRAALPEPVGCLEDWVRLPADESEVEERIRALAGRARRVDSGKPELDGDGVLRFRGRWVAIPPVEQRLCLAFLDRYQVVVGRQTLLRAGWPAGAPDRNVLDVHILRLRRRLAPVGLAIRTVRSRGYLLEATESIQEDVAEA